MIAGALAVVAEALTAQVAIVVRERGTEEVRDPEIKPSKTVRDEVPTRARLDKDRSLSHDLVAFPD